MDDRLIKFWGGDYGEFPLVHAEDGFYIKKPYAFDFRLFPQPWLGDLTAAKVFLLHLSPTWTKAAADYEKKTPAWPKALRANLLGRTPHLVLDPKFKDHPARAGLLARFKGTAPAGLLHRHLAQLFLVPYAHEDVAGDAKSRKLIDRFPTCEEMHNLLELNLAPRARAGEIGLIVMDGAAEWRLAAADECDDIVVYDAAESAAGLVTPRTRGGRLARRHFAALEG